jgi:preprotein translocase subunit SecG
MNALLITQVVLGILLSAAILMQSRGAGLGGAWGGTGTSYHSKRGAEKLLFRATIILAAIFLGTSILSVIMQA